MQRRNSNVGNKLRKFFQSLNKKKPPVQKEESLTGEEMAASTASFRADDILRSKLSNVGDTSLPLITSPPPKLEFEKESPIPRPTFPQIRPPAFSPVVNLKHITPFEHSEKPLFRARLSSAPPARSSSKPTRTPSPSPSISSATQQKSSPRPQPPRSQVYHVPSTYSWDSWERPMFNRAPGCLSLQTSDGIFMENQQLRSPNMYPPPPMPPPMLYYDPYSGQYLPPLGYTTVRRYSQSLGRRQQPSRSHHHQSRRSVGHYSTYDRNRSASCMSTRTPEPFSERQLPLIEPEVRVKVQQQPASQPQSINQSQQLPPTPQKLVQLKQDYPYEDEMRVTSKPQLVSSGTDDTPLQMADTVSPTFASDYVEGINNTNGGIVEGINNTNGRIVEAITPVYIPPTMVVGHPDVSMVKPPEDTIRYTSDVVRSLNRQAFKMGRRGSSDGALSPRDHYLEVVNGLARPVVREKVVLPNGRLNGGEKRPSVADLVKKFQQQEEEIYSPQMNFFRGKMDADMPIGDSVEISGDVSYADETGRPYRN